MSSQSIVAPGYLSKNRVENVTGSMYRIGDGHYLTAGHIAFEYNHAHDEQPNLISVNDIVSKSPGSTNYTVENDYRGFRSAYAQLVKTEYLGGKPGSNEQIEGRGIIKAKDSVIVASSGNTDKDSEGIVLLLNINDIKSTSAISGNPSVSFNGGISGTKSGGVVTYADNGFLSTTNRTWEVIAAVHFC